MGIIAIIFSVISFVASILSTRGMQQKVEAEEMEVLTADEGESVPVVFGKIWAGHNVVYFGEKTVEAMKDKVGGFMGLGSQKVTTGHKYYAVMQGALCYGVTDAIYEIRVEEDKIAFRGKMLPGSTTINQPSLFGGDSSSGGLSGVIDFSSGSPSDELNEVVSYYQSRELGSDDIAPDYKGISYFTLRGGSVPRPSPSMTANFLDFVANAIYKSNQKRGFYFGTSPYIKSIHMLISRVNKRSNGQDQWYKEKCGIVSSGSLIEAKNFNFSSIVYENQVFNKSNSTSGYWDADIDQFVVNGSGASYVPYGVYIESGGGGAFNAKRQSGIKISISGSSQDKEDSVFVNGKFIVSYPEGYVVEPYMPIDVLINETIETTVGTTKRIEYDISFPAENKAFEFSALLSKGDGSGNVSIYVEINGVYVIQDSDSMNPVHVVRECLTDESWGRGLPESDIDEVSFRYAADVLYDEGFGVSLSWNREKDVSEFIEDIMRYIGGYLYMEPSTGKQVIKLARADYDPESIQTISKKDIIGVSDFSRSMHTELVNSITVSYTNIESRGTSTVTVQDAGLFAMTGEIISKSVDYPGIVSAEIAGRIAMRDLKSMATPLVAMEIELKRSSGFNLRQGDVVKLDLPKFGLEQVVVRVSSVDFGDAKSNRVLIEVVEDVYSTPDSSVVVNNDAALRPSRQIKQLEDVYAFEATYMDLVERSSAGSVNSEIASNPSVGYFSMVSGATESTVSSIQLHTRYVGSNYEYQQKDIVDHPIYGEIVSSIDDKTSFIILDSSSSFEAINIYDLEGTRAMIGDEIVLILDIDYVGDQIYIEIMRGILDTIPRIHPAGSSFYAYQGKEGIDQTAYSSGDDVGGVLVPETSSGVADVFGADEKVIEIKGRAARPYPPANVSFSWSLGGDLTITYRHRNRLDLQAVSWNEDVSYGPEPGTTYIAEVYKGTTLVGTGSSSTEEIVILESDIDAFGGDTLTIMIESERDGLRSYYKYEVVTENPQKIAGFTDFIVEEI